MAGRGGVTTSGGRGEEDAEEGGSVKSGTGASISMALFSGDGGVAEGVADADAGGAANRDEVSTRTGAVPYSCLVRLFLHSSVLCVVECG
jgi:hypothetical protein